VGGKAYETWSSSENVADSPLITVNRGAATERESVRAWVARRMKLTCRSSSTDPYPPMMPMLGFSVVMLPRLPAIPVPMVGAATTEEPWLKVIRPHLPPML